MFENKASIVVDLILYIIWIYLAKMVKEHADDQINTEILQREVDENPLFMAN